MQKRVARPDDIGEMIDEIRSYFRLPTPQVKKNGQNPSVQGGLIAVESKPLKPAR